MRAAVATALLVFAFATPGWMAGVARAQVPDVNRALTLADTQSTTRPSSRVLSSYGLEAAEEDGRSIPLNGTWKFRLGDNALWLSSTIDDSEWTTLDPAQPLPDSLVVRIRAIEAQGMPAIGWLRLHLVIDKSVIGKPLAFAFQPFGASEVFVGGDRILSLGNLDRSGALASISKPDASVPIVFTSEDAVVAVRFHLGTAVDLQKTASGISLFTAAIVPGRTVARMVAAERLRYSILLGMAGIFGALGLLHLVLYALLRNPVGNLYYAFFALLLAGFLLVSYVSSTDVRMLQWMDKVSIVALTLAFLALLAFLYSTLRGKLGRSMWIVTGLAAIVVASPFTSFSSATRTILSLGLLLYIVEGSRVILVGVWKKRDGSRIIGAGFFLAFALVGYVALGELGVAPKSPNNNAALVGLIGFALSASIYLARNFARSSKGFEDLSLHLEEQVEERTVELRAAKALADSANETKSQFLANMSHELRTPLNAIIGYSEMLTEEAEDSGNDAYLPDLDKIRSSGKHLLGLINDILDLTKIESGRMELYLENFDVSAMVQDVASTVRPLLEKNSNSVRLQIAPDVGTIRADQVKLRQILFNLLSNASKFTEAGTVTLEVARLGGSEGTIVFRVNDTGIGMNDEQVSRLFQPFMQAESSTTKKYGGTGLGLAISKHLTEIMGGTISVDSYIGRGTSFTVRIPAVVVDTHIRMPAVDETTAITPVRDSSAAAILVIDDEPTARDMISRMLVKEGYRVITAPSGEDGLAMAARLKPDAITLDIMMNGMDGWSVLSRLKGNPATAAIPVVVISVIDDRNLSFALGAADYLAKPVDRDRLSETLLRVRARGEARSVLLIEDEADTRRMMRRLFEKEGWSVTEAENGRAGLAAIDAQTPGLVLLDLMMSEMDGFEFIEELRKRPEGKLVPVVVLTAKDLTESDKNRLRGTVENVLQKGNHNNEVLSEVRRVLVKSHS